jgi:hypothetical protein
LNGKISGRRICSDFIVLGSLRRTNQRQVGKVSSFSLPSSMTSWPSSINPASFAFAGASRSLGRNAP